MLNVIWNKEITINGGKKRNLLNRKSPFIQYFSSEGGKKKN